MIQEELSGMRREIGQARELLRDAIEKLMLSFTAIGQAADVEGKAERSDARARVIREVGVAVTALQFQDMVDQLLNHVLKRVDALEEEIGLEAASAAPPGNAAASPTSGKPVSQRRMDPGESELF